MKALRSDITDTIDSGPTARVAPRLNETLSSLLKDRLTQPIYFRVVLDKDGDLVIEQIAFLRIDDLAALIGFDDRTIRGWAAAGKIPSFKPPGSSVNLFDLNEVLKWIKQQDSLDNDNGRHLG
jgi:excisionase family DNA binding protein